MSEPTIYELSSPGREGVKFPDGDIPQFDLPEGCGSRRFALS